MLSNINFFFEAIIYEALKKHLIMELELMYNSILSLSLSLLNFLEAKKSYKCYTNAQNLQLKRVCNLRKC